MDSALIMELGIEVGKLKGSNNVLRIENKRLNEINNRLISSLEKLAGGVNTKEQIGEGYHRQNNE